MKESGERTAHIHYGSPASVVVQFGMVKQTFSDLVQTANTTQWKSKPAECTLKEAAL